jgi:hypothetical protein
MENTELRLGNWVCSYGAIYVQVAQLTKGKIMIDATPIPLTGKWLKKFDFIKEAKGVWYKCNEPWVYQIEKHPSFPDGYMFFIDISGEPAPPSVRIRYVHQLQNLYYALTGEELTIKE